MRRILIPIFIIVALLAIHFAVFPQTISYAYDYCGNRIKREIRLNSNKIPGHSNVTEMYLQEKLSEHNLKIYPNPTKGQLKVEIVGYEPSDVGLITLFSLSGQVLFSDHLNSAHCFVDISNNTNGIYILQISINGKSTSWKIIKE